ncbi:hypothetical protein [Leptolyngbya sp. KIOST-1]|nr:hypothetical protein [Leptolyngbya sp. KIOST-1]
MVQTIQPIQDQRILQSDRIGEQFQWMRRGGNNAPGVTPFRQGIQPAAG